jgi:ABC-2 type transport system ATP-binding protein
MFGDSIHVELPEPEPAGKVRIALERVGGFQNLVFEGRSLRIRTPHGAKAVPGIVGALELEGIKATSVQVSRPSLDDVYLKYTGRTFSEANSGAAG